MRESSGTPGRHSKKEDVMKALVRVSSLVLIGLIAALTLTAAGDGKAAVV